MTCNDVPLSSGYAPSDEASTIQAERVLDEIEEHHEDGFPSLDDPGPWEDQESDTLVDESQGEPNKSV